MIFSCHAASFCPLQPHFWLCHAPCTPQPSPTSHSPNQMSVFDLFRPLCSNAAFCTFSTPRYLNSTQPLFSTVLPPRWVLGFSRGLRVVESRSCEVVGNLTRRGSLTTRRGNPTHCTAGHCSQQSLEAPTAPRKRYTAKIRSPTNAQNIFLHHEGEKTSTVVGKR